MSMYQLTHLVKAAQRSSKHWALFPEGYYSDHIDGSGCVGPLENEWKDSQEEWVNRDGDGYGDGWLCGDGYGDGWLCGDGEEEGSEEEDLSYCGREKYSR